MNIDILLQNADTLITTPQDVAKLRQLILALAVQGKLVPQDAGDEPAEIISKKAITNLQDFSKMLPQIMSDHLPMNWTLTYLGNIAEWGSGSTPSRGMNQYYGGDVVWLKSGELNDSQHVLNSEEHITETALNECSFRKNKPGDVLIAMYGATIGKVAILATNAVTNQAVLGCTPHSCVYNRFLFYYLLSQKQNFMNMSEGGAQPNISKIKVQSYPIPLPPLAEQRRIVARVDELMAHCDQLEAQLQARQHQQRAVVAAALARASTDPTPAHVATLFTPGLGVSPAELRQLILALAVQGKLVPQEAGDEPAEVLLDVTTTSLPKGWKKKILDEIIIMMDSGWSPDCMSIPALPNEWGILKTTAIQDLKYEEFENKALPHNMLPRPNAEVKNGDVLFTRAGPYNRVGIVCVAYPTRPFLMLSDKIIRMKFNSEVIPEFIAMVFSAGETKNQVNSMKSGMAASQVNISQSKLRTLQIPLPPLAEQRRIVARVDALMALVDQLEAQQAHASALGAQVLDAVVGGV